MKKRAVLEKIQRFGKVAYLKIFRINDTPLKIALGFGLGAFVGVMPGIGPVIALMLAFLFRVNRASTLLASVLFNTWVSFIALLLAMKIGAVVMGLNYQDVYAAGSGIFKDFTFEKLFALSVHDVLVPIVIGYLIISVAFAAVAGIIVYFVAFQIRRHKISKG